MNYDVGLKSRSNIVNWLVPHDYEFNVQGLIQGDTKKMNAILNFLLLLLPLCLVNGSESETFCSAMNDESLRYTIRSRKNETSHRIVSVDLQKDSALNKWGNATTDVDMDVAHTYLQCGGKERIMLSTMATSEPLDKTGYSRWVSGQPDGNNGQNYIGANKDGLLRDIPNTFKLGSLQKLFTVFRK
ncbi:uncharacterized protein [Anabrus simplex]|uniref:uncharacterized protein n=1 Tax=Anabrus simplex TaxID=316456 RepID=UPI0035A3A45D